MRDPADGWCMAQTSMPGRRGARANSLGAWSARCPGSDPGGSSGIGRAVALALAEAGADVVVDYHRREDDARSTCEAIEARGARAIAIRADVGVARDVERMVGEVVERRAGSTCSSTTLGTRR